jgi:hypothetical protein
MQAGAMGQGTAAGGAPASAADAGWLPLNQPAAMVGLEWRGTTKIHQESQCNWSKKQREQFVINMTTPLHWFCSFFDKDVIFRIVQQTNFVVTAIRERPLPAGYHEAWAWLPGWAAEWQPLTCRVLLEWVALVIYMVCHKTSNKRCKGSPFIGRAQARPALCKWFQH